MEARGGGGLQMYTLWRWPCDCLEVNVVNTIQNIMLGLHLRCIWNLRFF